MYGIKKTFEVAGSHSLNLDYESKCGNLHGHNWIITIYAEAEELDNNGMVVDFTNIKKLVHDVMDHKNLNEIFKFNPTAENIARWICQQNPLFKRVEVQESSGNIAWYEKDNNISWKCTDEIR